MIILYIHIYIVSNQHCPTVCDVTCDSDEHVTLLLQSIYTIGRTDSVQCHRGETAIDACQAHYTSLSPRH